MYPSRDDLELKRQIIRDWKWASNDSNVGLMDLIARTYGFNMEDNIVEFQKTLLRETSLMTFYKLLDELNKDLEKDPNSGPTNRAIRKLNDTICSIEQAIYFYLVENEIECDNIESYNCVEEEILVHVS